jgi:23S rRNA pseudouridine1911/1915/1917 synthase
LFEDPADLPDEGELLRLIATTSGPRLDKWLTGQLPERSRAEVQRWIEAGQVTLAGRLLKASYRVGEGDAIDVVVHSPENYDVEPEDIPLDVLYEDRDLLVITAGRDGSASAADCTAPGQRRTITFDGRGRRTPAGHRSSADKDTSGVILVAKADVAHRNLQAQFRVRRSKKNTWHWCAGDES